MEEAESNDASANGKKLCLLSTLLQVVAREDNGGVPQDAEGLAIPEFICKATLVELLSAAAPLHACRKRHRYIRPWTVAVTSSGRVELAGGKGFEDSRLSANSSAECMQSFVDGAQDRWYWTPERLMGSEKDGMEVDIWSIGAIFAEMLLGSPIFYGFDPANQLFTMFKVLGFPTRSQLSYLGSGYDQLVLPKGPMRASLRDKLPCLSHDGHDLLRRLLDWCPNNRISAAQALQHPYLSQREITQHEARTNIVQFLIQKAADLSGISQEVSQLSDDDEMAEASESRVSCQGSRVLCSPSRQEQLSAACNLYTALDVPIRGAASTANPASPGNGSVTSTSTSLSSSANLHDSASRINTSTRTRKNLASIAPSKGAVVPDSPTAEPMQASSAALIAQPEAHNLTTGDRETMSRARVLRLTDMDEADGGDARGTAVGAGAADDVQGAQSPAAAIRSSGLIQLRVPNWEGILEEAGIGASMATTLSHDSLPIESPVSLASVSGCCYPSADGVSDANVHYDQEERSRRVEKELAQRALKDAASPKSPSLNVITDKGCKEHVDGQHLDAQCDAPETLPAQWGVLSSTCASECAPSASLSLPLPSPPSKVASIPRSPKTRHITEMNNRANHAVAHDNICRSPAADEKNHASCAALARDGSWPVPEVSAAASQAGGSAAVVTGERNDGHGEDGSASLSSGDKWGAFEHGKLGAHHLERVEEGAGRQTEDPSGDRRSEEGQFNGQEDAALSNTASPIAAIHKSVEESCSPDWVPQLNDLARSSLPHYSSLHDRAHIKSTAKISLLEIKKLLRHKWVHVKSQMEAGMQGLRAAVTRCKTILEHGSAVAAVCRGGVGDEQLIALVREEMKVIHRGCKDALEESKGVQAEYRNLKVALTETEANVKYMMQHCSNESSFAISAESGTEAELERHELMLAAVLRGKARFGRHRRNLQAQLVQQAQGVSMLDHAMTAVQGRVALVAQQPCENSSKTAAHSGVGGVGSSASVADCAMPLGQANGRRARRGVLPPRWRQCWGVAEEDCADDVEEELVGSERYRAMEIVRKHVDECAGVAAADTSNLDGGPQRSVGKENGVGDAPVTTSRDLRRLPVRAACSYGCRKSARERERPTAGATRTTTTTITRSRRRVEDGSDAGWYYSERSVYSERSWNAGVGQKDEDEDLWQLLEACDDAEQMLCARSEAFPTGRDGTRQALLVASSKPRSSVAGLGGAPGSLRKATGASRAEAVCRPGLESTALKSIENHVLSLCKTVSTVEKQQRATAAKVAKLLKDKGKSSASRGQPAATRASVRLSQRPAHPRQGQLTTEWR